MASELLLCCPDEEVFGTLEKTIELTYTEFPETGACSISGVTGCVGDEECPDVCPDGGDGCAEEDKVPQTCTISPAHVDAVSGYVFERDYPIFLQGDGHGSARFVVEITTHIDPIGGWRSATSGDYVRLIVSAAPIMHVPPGFLEQQWAIASGTGPVVDVHSGLNPFVEFRAVCGEGGDSVAMSATADFASAFEDYLAAVEGSCRPSRGLYVISLALQSYDVFDEVANVALEGTITITAEGVSDCCTANIHDLV